MLHVAPARPRTPAPAVPARRRALTDADREEISRGIAQGLTGKLIAERIGRDPSVVSREISRHGGWERYRATRATHQAAADRHRPTIRKLDGDPVLREQVMTTLRAGRSPDQVAGRLRYEHPGQHARRVSHEAIYTWLYALPQGELARLGITLRSGRTQRRPRGRATSPGARIVGMTSIDARPAEVTGRQIPGHGEGDLVIGQARKTAMPTPLVTTLTWDQDSEMAAHAAFTLVTNVAVYFAHPHSPWERGTNDNTNRLLREYFPKSTDITDDQTYLNLVAAELNNRPRRILSYRTPAKVFTDILTSSIASTG